MHGIFDFIFLYVISNHWNDSMRKNAIGEKVFNLLLYGEVEDAVVEFNKECDINLQCVYREKLDKCTKLCLLPKLNFMLLNANDLDIKDMVAAINKNMEQ